MERKRVIPTLQQTSQMINAPLIDRDIAVNELAKRDPIAERYDILDTDFLRIMALIAGYGARKYGERNWQKSRLEGDKSPINHILKHLVAYQNGEPYDHPEIATESHIHLAAIAFNAMMEFYHEFKKWETETYSE